MRPSLPQVQFQLHLRRARRWLARSATLLLLSAGLAQAATPERFRDLQVQVVGSGQPLLMIPGLNSAAAVWAETCAALQPALQCHIVQLPGFAGAPAAASERWLEAMRDQLLAYLDARALSQPVLMGHSLGGALALMMAAEAPQRIDRLVIVDALPFLAALRDPQATPERARALAGALRSQLQAASDEQWNQGARAAARGMTRDPALTERVRSWVLASDRATSTQAMSELWGLDLRPLLPRIERPVLVLGAWAAYAPLGATLEGTRRLYEAQFSGLPRLQLRISEQGFHFLMWDDAAWLQTQVRGFLEQP